MTTFWILLTIYIISAVVNLIISTYITTKEGTDMHDGHMVAIFFPLINTITAIAFSIMLYIDKKKKKE